MPGFAGFFGIDSVKDKVRYPDGQITSCRDRQVIEKAFELYRIVPTPNTKIAAFVLKDHSPLIISTTHKSGRVSLITAPYGLNSERLEGSVGYDYLNTVKQYLGEYLDQERIIDINNRRLQYCV